ncbi:G1 family glutamic endopeptidase [Segeticoccus rhizosphaerae]|jgi:hypothetical protein|uniref:G1 family glutamic endopeptidase n=1 Tax=Segeticoccus rhizosphaerae TaxID=1104777 RepID=UPI0010C060DC|nr:MULTISPECIES: G1 family glutamic endopeptidase [Intrasporangiaceae]
MAEQQTSDRKGLRLRPAPPKEFDPFAASTADLHRHGLPLRPDPQTQPGMAALWDRQARRYRGFEHVEPRADTATAGQGHTEPRADTAIDERPTEAGSRPAPVPALGPAPIESCGYSLTSLSAPFTALFVTWTVPDLHFSASALGLNRFHTFVGLGFLDVHVEMTVDSAQNVTSQLWAQGVGQVGLSVRPGDVLSGSLCLDTKPPGTAHYFLANETTAQTMNFTVDTGYPPAVTVDMGVTRDDLNQPAHPLAGFGVVYFDEISIYTTGGGRLLPSGQAITMVDERGRTLARPYLLNDFACKVVFVAA